VTFLLPAAPCEFRARGVEPLGVRPAPGGPRRLRTSLIPPAGPPRPRYRGSVSTPDLLTISERSIAPGERVRVDLPVADLPNHAPLAMPVEVLRGKRPGPTLFVCAAIHGDEVNGVEILRRLLRHRRLRNLRGTLIAVPIVNVFGFVGRSRYLPDRRDLNRCFPGTERGSLASRMARIFMEQVVAKATHGLDLHTGSQHRTNLPQVRVSPTDEVAHQLARAFGAPVVMESSLRDGSLRAAVAEAGLPVLVYEAGEALRFDEWAIRPGLRGILRIMEALEMLPPSRKRKAPPPPLWSRASKWVRAPISGILRPVRRLGDWVEPGDLLATLGDPLGREEVEVQSPLAGLVVGRTNLPALNEGDALYHLAQGEGSGEGMDSLEPYEVDLDQPPLYEPDEAE